MAVEANTAFYGIAATSGGGVVAVGSLTIEGHPGAAVAFYDADLDLNLIWKHVYEVPGVDPLHDVAVAPDGTIIAVGSTEFALGSATDYSTGFSIGDAVIVAMSPTDGTIKWAKTYGGSQIDTFDAVAIAADGTIFVAGNTASTDGDFPSTRRQGDIDAVIAAIDPADGTLKWAKTYGGEDADYFYGMTIAADGTIVVVGSTYSSFGDFPRTGYYPYGSRAVVAAVNPADGTLMWAKVFQGDKDDEFKAAAVAADGTIVAAGWATSTQGDFGASHGATDAVVAAVNPADGAIKWAKTYGGTRDDYFTGVAITADDTIVAVGTTSSKSGTFGPTRGLEDSVVAGINLANGSLRWTTTCGGSNEEEFKTVTIVDGTIVAAGYTKSWDGDFPTTPGLVGGVVVTVAVR